jgi:hypothetical protein
MTTNVLLAVLLVCVAHVYALNCSALSAVVEVQHAGTYTQYLQDVWPLSDVKTLFVEHATTRDLKGDMHIERQDSFLGRAWLVVPNQEVFNGKITEHAISSDVAKTLLQPQGVEIKQLNQQSVLFGVSNAIRVPGLYKDGDNKPKDGTIAIVNVLTPAPNTTVDSINFLIVDAEDSIANNNATFGAITYKASATAEDYYNVDGQVVGQQDKTQWNATNVSYDALDFSSVSHQKIIATRLLSANVTAFSTISVDFIVLVNTQDSVKLVRYQVTAVQSEKKASAPTIVSSQEIFSTVIVPRVESLPSAGAVIQVYGNEIYIAASVMKLQSKAFKTLHNIDLEFDTTQKSSSFLFRVNVADGKILWATNVAISSVPHTVADAGFPAEIAVQDGQALVVSNTFDVPTRTNVGVDASLKSYISHISFSVAGVLNKSVQSLNGLIDERAKKGKSKEDVDNLRFVAYSVAFPMDNAPGRALVGGTVGGHLSFWNTAGRLVLTRFSEDPKADAGTVYDLEVGYSGSNAVRIVRRVASGDSYLMQLGLYFNGPTSQPPANIADDKFRSVSAAFWLVNCDAQNFKMEQAFTIVFYTVFGIVCFSLVSAVIGFTIKGIYEYRKGKEERRSLLQ